MKKIACVLGNHESKTCYANAQRDHTDVYGRATIRLVTRRDGTIAAAEDGGSDIGDGLVVDCIAEAFKRMRIPAPEGTYTYSVLLRKK